MAKGFYNVAPCMTDLDKFLSKFSSSMIRAAKCWPIISETVSRHSESFPSRFLSTSRRLTIRPNSDSLVTIQYHERHVRATPRSKVGVERFSKICTKPSSGKFKIETSETDIFRVYFSSSFLPFWVSIFCYWQMTTFQFGVCQARIGKSVLL